MLPLRVLSVLSGAALLASCAGGGIPQHRASQYGTIFNQWDEPTRARLLEARAQIGDTREMVYVAYGVPLKPPVLTDASPPLEHWEYLTYETEPVFPGNSTVPLTSSPSQPVLRAQTVNNVFFPNPFTAPPLRLLVVEFGPDDRLAGWKLYPDAQDRALGEKFQPIMLPKKLRPAD